MIWELLNSQNIYADLLALLISIPALLFSLSCHEYAHGFAAYKQGDHMAKSLGRLTLNPFKHIDPLGALAMLLIGFGWAKPVPINPSNFKDGKKSMLIVSLAGVITNMFLALVAVFLLFFIRYVIPQVWFSSETMYFVYLILSKMLNYLVMLNCALAIFNLMPVPPLDGYNVVKTLVANHKNMNFFWNVERYQTYILIGFLLISNRIGIIDGLSFRLELLLFDLMDIIFSAFI